MRFDSNPIFPPRLPTALPRAVLAPLLAAALTAGAEPRSEPTDAAEAARKRSAEAALDDRYQALVAGLPPDERAWEGVLQANLGSFYLPIHKRDRVAGRSTAWDFVKDDPALPRVLLIGDSISRGYTLPVRAALVREANVHRAPANCGPTASGLANLDAWLSSAPGGLRWDVIHFNFGIHDRNTPLADYTARLERIVARLQETGAALVWASSTPIPDLPARQQSAASIVERNTAAAKIMERHGVAIDDLFAFIEPHLAATRLPDDVHFRAEGYELLGGRVAEAIRAALK